LFLMVSLECWAIVQIENIKVTISYSLKNYSATEKGL
jgi:hypothetical protein